MTPASNCRLRFLALFLCSASLIQGKLVFRDLLHDARIYEGAPPGVHVTTVQAYDNEGGRKSVMYSLLDVRDDSFFGIDSVSGNISTVRVINREAGKTYDIIAVAISQGETKLRQLQVQVTVFNEHSPALEQEVYRGEIHIKTSVGSQVLRIRAIDADPVPYNSEIYYRLDPEDPKGRFALDPLTGSLTLARPLDTMPMQPVVEMGIMAEDGGSPKGSDTAKIEVLIKTISEPRDVRYTNATGSKVQICWTRPKHGKVFGYIVKYREVENPHGSPSFHNISSNASAICTSLVDLKAWTDYEFRVYGWNQHETGQGSSVGRFGTRPDYCQMNICQHGDCHMLNEEPGYHCDCTEGYYGDVCDKFNPCSLTPCENFGICLNVTHNKYRCECPYGFSGVNCSEFNPCAMRPSPCLHGGRCESTASHKYQCYCTKGYYGKTCQFFDPCSNDPCRNGGRCMNVSQTDFACNCALGYSGKQCEHDVDECASSPCKHGGLCVDSVNNFHCQCAAGYRGKRCHLIEHCIPQTVHSNKGLFRWNSTAHGRAFLIECPFGSTFPDREGATGYAKRRCYLLSNGSVAWGKMDLTSCREEGFKNAEDLTGELRMLTQDPKHLNVARIQEAAKQIENVLDYAIHDKKIAHNMLSIVSNILDIDDTVLETGDKNGTTATRLTDIVDKFVAEVKLEKGEGLSLETENLVVKALSWDPDTSDLGEAEEGVVFSVRYRNQRQRRDQGRGNKHHSPSVHNRLSEPPDETPSNVEEDSELVIPLEALLLGQNQSYQDVRVMFVAYKNDKFFRSRHSNSKSSCWKRDSYGKNLDCADHNGLIRFPGRRVLQVSIANTTVSNLSDPLVFTLPSPLRLHSFCAYWKENERLWSTDGLITNQSENTTTCYSTHMTAFSLLLDPTPGEGISPDHQFALSMISYIGCGLSMLGLSLTILTYSLFRCLNRDHPGQILLHLCSSMLLMNAAFVAGSQKGHDIYGVDVCVTVAVLVHYFLLTTLSWMGVEAANMYQLLVNVFDSAETRFMLKRAILAWGIPLLIVGVTVLIDWGVYQNQNEYCMLSSTNPYVYYISYLGPSCLILLVNFTVFIMVTRVLFTPRHITKPTAVSQKKDKVTVTAAQVRGAFSVMILLGVSWIFGAFAVREARLVFRYLFCIANSLQGFLVFLVRCLQYPEARSAWYQLWKTGTLKKYRGMVPPGSWSGNSNSSHNKQNGHSNTTRLGSADANAFNTNFWNKEIEKEEERPPYEDQPPDTGVGYVARSAQLLTFSASTKQEMNEAEEQAKRFTEERSVSRSVSSSSDIKSQTLKRSTPIQSDKSDDESQAKRIALPRDAVLPQETEVLTVPRDTSRSSYGSTIGCINEEGEDKTSNVERNAPAPKSQPATVQPKTNSPPDIDKQNSWPRTLSSFLSGKDVVKSSLSDITHHAGTLPKRMFTPTGKSPLAECPERHAFQIIPLQVRPTTPLTHHPSPLHPSRTLSSDSDGAEVPTQMTESYCSGVVEAASHGERAWNTLGSRDSRQRSLPNCTPFYPTRTDLHRKTSVDFPTETRSSVCPQSTSNAKTISELSGSHSVLPVEETFRIWERQGLVSPSKAMFIDSAASRL